jgi:archaellum component FlaC
MGLLGGVVGALWVVGSLAAAVVLIGPSRVTALTIPEAGAVAAVVVLPAMMAWFSGLAAADSARARAEARRLADAADRLMNPERSAEEAARQLAMSVRGEISTLDRALEATLARLQDVEGQIQRQAQAVDEMTDQAKAGANQMIAGMEREREELLRISRDLTNQAQTIGDSISKHTQSISEAARQAEAEVRAADQALDHRLTSFGAAAALISDRTNNLSSAAQASADSALRLEQALSNALDVLSKATSLTDAARQSAEAAALAANSTAGAVRETTHRAVDDAKRAAELIRGEAVAVEREAAIALERLRDAAEAARHAAVGARSAVEDAQPRAVRNRAREAEIPGYDRAWRDEAKDPLELPPQRGRDEPQPPMFGEEHASAGPPPRPERPAAGDWTWRDLLSNVDGAAQQSAHREPASDPVGHLRRRIPSTGAAPALPIVALIERAGIQLDTAFSPSALERVAQRARSGTQARRRAVRDAAPAAAQLMTDFLAQDQNANQEAMAFLRGEGLRVSELLARGRATMHAEATRAFLLIDAAFT